MLTIGMSSHSMAAETAAEPIDQIDEVDVTTRKQSALDAEAISLSDTPDAEPSVGGKTSIVIGLAARVAPVYDGSKTTKTSPFPYVDIHGLFHDRVFISDIRGIGFNVVDLGAFRAGMSLNYVGGRTSKDAPRLQGLPDIGGAAAVGAFMTYSVKPFAFEFKVNREFGSQPGTEVQLGASVGMVCADGALGFGDAPRTQRPHRLSREEQSSDAAHVRRGFRGRCDLQILRSSTSCTVNAAVRGPTQISDTDGRLAGSDLTTVTMAAAIRVHALIPRPLRNGGYIFSAASMITLQYKVYA